MLSPHGKLQSMHREVRAEKQDANLQRYKVSLMNSETGPVKPKYSPMVSSVFETSLMDRATIFRDYRENEKGAGKSMNGGRM